MSGLPENWEWDYDGTRWFYRYKPTGLIQYTFPKPGDEFPEFIDDSAPAPDLAPEEKLVSQQQIKRRSTVGQSSRQSTTATNRERAPSNAVSDPDDGGGPFWLQPDGLMYMGPGAYTDISPLQEEEEERGLEGGTTGEKGAPDASVPASATVTTGAIATPTAEGTPSQGTPQPTRSQISPVVSTETTPHVVNSKPATTTPELDGAVIIEARESVPVDAGVVEPPEIPLLDSRQVPYNPIGFVAELASELTARCDDEINPAPVELPGHEIMMDVSEPALYANAFHLAPVELPSDEVSAKPKVASNAAEQKSLAPHIAGQRQDGEQQQRAYQAAQELLNRPYKPVRQNSLPQSTSTAKLPSKTNVGSTPGQYQPYNPARHAVLGPAAANRYPVTETESRQLAGDNKRHSLAGPVLSQFRPPDIPPALQAPQVPPKRPLDSPDNPQLPPKRPLDASDNGAHIPVAQGRHDSISGRVEKGNSSGLTHFPSILQPARGRPVMRAQSPPQSQGASPARTYQAYNPYRDLQKDIEDTVQLLSQTGYGQGTIATPEPSNPPRPQVSRSGTLPAHLPALPYMGDARPQLPPSAVSEPVTLRSLQQTPSSNTSANTPSGGSAGIAVFQEYSAPLPPSSPDLPQPLNLSRKSPPPPTSVPAITPFRPPVTAEPTQTSQEPMLAISDTHIVSAPVTATSGPQTMGVVGRTGAGAGQAETVTQPAPPTAPSPPQQTVELKDTNGTDRVLTSSELPQAAIQAPPQQAGANGVSVMVESSVLPASQVAALPQQVPVKAEAANHPAAAMSFSVEAAEIPPILMDTRNAPIALHTASASQPATSGAETMRASHTAVVADQQPTPSISEVVEQGTSQPISPKPSLVPSGNAQSSSHVVDTYQPAIEVSHQPPPQPSATPPADQTPQAQVSHLSDVSSAPPATLAHKSSSSNTGIALDKRATTPPQSSGIQQPPGIRTPSPISCASSPPVQQGYVSHNIHSVSPPEAARGVAQQHAQSSQGVQNQGAIHPPAVGHGPVATASPPPPPNATSAAGSTAPIYTIPSGHHPLSSHPVNAPKPYPGEPSKPDPGNLGAGDPSQQLSSGPSVQSPPVPQPPAPPAAQSNAGSPQTGETPAQQQLSQPPAHTPVPSQVQTIPAPSPAPVQQGAASMPNQRQTGQPPMPQAAPHAGQSQPPMQPFGQTAQMPPVQGKAAALPFGPGQMPAVQFKPPTLPFGPGQAPQNPPQRTFSHPVVSRPGPPPHPGAPGSAPPQMPMMFAPPAVPQGVQPGMLPQQYAFVPGMVPQPRIQPQPVPPHMMQPSQMPSGPAYVMQQPQPAQPAKEEKSWFGKLWRSESDKKPAAASIANPANKLQKPPRSQASLVFPPQLQPSQPVPAPQFPPPGTQAPQHMVMLPMQQGQQAPNMQQQQHGAQQPQVQPQQAPTAQLHQHQQYQHQQQAPQQPLSQPQQQPPPQFTTVQLHPQQQQPLAWKSNGAENKPPQFHAPNHNPNKPIVPPPQVRQAIQQQEQRLGQVWQGQGQGQSQGSNQVQAQQVYGLRQSHGQGQGQIQVARHGNPTGNAGQSAVSQQAGNLNQVQAQGKAAPAVPAAAAAAAGNSGASRWGNTHTGGYDGSGWGDDDEDYS